MAKKDEDVCLGIVVRRRRLAMNLTQAQLGVPLALSYQQVQKYETATNRVAFSTLMQLAAALDCTVAELVADVEREMKARGLGIIRRTK